MSCLNVNRKEKDLLHKESFWLKLAFDHCCETARNYLKGVVIWCKVTSQQLVTEVRNQAREAGQRSGKLPWGRGRLLETAKGAFLWPLLASDRTWCQTGPFSWWGGRGKVQRRQRNKTTKLEVFLWQIINAFSLRNCKQAEKGLTWREWSKTEIKALMPKLLQKPLSAEEPWMQLGRLWEPNTFWNELVTKSLGGYRSGIRQWLAASEC